MPRRYLAIGIFIIAGVTLFALGIFLVGSRHEAFSRHVLLYTEFADLDGIAKGSKVQVAGMDFIRVRMGVKPEHPIADLADYVLCPMNKEHREVAKQMAGEAAEAVEIILSEGPGKAMTKFNRRVEPEPGGEIDEM